MRREAIEWCDAWMPHMNDHDLPRVLLIGDSIAKGYYSAVEANLKGRACVARVSTSKAIGDPALLSELKVFLAQAQYDVIHFNIGMHGWAYTEVEYRQNFPALVKAIRRGAPAAKLIWASTTPIRKDLVEYGATNSRIEARNLAAREYAAAHGIPVNDLYALMLPHADLHSDDVHFNQEGSAMLGGQVAREIAKLLPRKSR